MSEAAVTGLTETLNNVPLPEAPPDRQDAPELVAAEQDTPKSDPVPSSPLDDDAIDSLVAEGYKEFDAIHRKLAALEEKLVLIYRKAIYTTSDRLWARYEGELDALMEQLNEVRYESALLPILENVCPAAADPSNEEAMKAFSDYYLSPVKGRGTYYQKGRQVSDYSSPNWLTRAEKETIWNAYMLPNTIRDRIAQLGIRCLDAKEMLSRFRGLARRLAKASKP
jgi:hypothetical protein